MNSTLVFSLKDLLLLILWGSIVTLFIYLILVVKRAFHIVKQMDQLIKENRSQIDATIDILPSLTENLDAITEEVAHDMQAFRGTVDNIAETTEAVSKTVKENKGFVEGLSSFMHTVSIAKVLYDKYFGNVAKDIKEASEDVANTRDKTE